MQVDFEGKSAQDGLRPQPPTSRPEERLTLHERMKKYVEAAAKKIVERLGAKAVKGNRNNALFGGAKELGRLLGWADLTWEDAENYLRRAVENLGIAEGNERREAWRTIRSGLKCGSRNPRDMNAILSRRGTCGEKLTRKTVFAKGGREEQDPHPVPADQMRAVWDAALPVTEDAVVARFLEERGLVPPCLAASDLVRALNCIGPRFPWMSYNAGDWWLSGHRLLLPAFDAAGVLATIRARHFGACESKEISPRGAPAGRAVYANNEGWSLLNLGGFREGTAPSARKVFIAEGGPDFLSLSSAFLEADGDEPAVFGVFSGAWCDDIAARVPPGTEVILWVHHDAAGDGYAQSIARSLSGRCPIRRSKRSLHVSE